MRRRDAFQFAESNGPDSCLLTFTICFHLQEGELHPLDSISRPGCVGFGQFGAVSYFALARTCYTSCLTTTHLYASWGWGLQSNRAALLIIAGRRSDVSMTSWFTLAP